MINPPDLQTISYNLQECEKELAKLYTPLWWWQRESTEGTLLKKTIKFISDFDKFVNKNISSVFSANDIKELKDYSNRIQKIAKIVIPNLIESKYDDSDDSFIPGSNSEKLSIVRNKIYERESSLLLGFVYQGNFKSITDCLNEGFDLINLTRHKEDQTSKSLLQHIFNTKISKNDKVEVFKRISATGKSKEVFYAFLESLRQSKENINKESLEFIEDFISNDLLRISYDIVPEHMEILLNSGINLQIQSSNGQTLLHQLLDGFPSPKSLDLLLRAYPELTKSVDQAGYTPLHRVMLLSPAEKYDYETAKTKIKGANFKNTVTKLLKNGANINARDNSGRTVLHLLFMEASNYGKKANPETYGIYVYIKKQIVNQMKFLIKKGAKCDLRDNEQRYPLFYAIERLPKDMQMNVCSSLYKTAFKQYPKYELKLALKKYYPEVACLILKNTQLSTNDFFISCGKELLAEGDPEMLMVLTDEWMESDHEGLKNVIKKHFMPYLFEFAKKRPRKALMLLLRLFVAAEKYPEVWSFDEYITELMAIHFNTQSVDGNEFIFMHDFIRSISKFFEAGLCEDLERLNKVLNRVNQSLELIIQKGIKPAQPDKLGKKPLYYAMKYCSEQAVRNRICKTLCELDQDDSYPENELRFALEEGFEDIVRLILKKYGFPKIKVFLEFLESMAKRGDCKMLAILLNAYEIKHNQRLDDALFLIFITQNLQEDPSEGLMDNRVEKQSHQYAKSDEEFSQNQKYYNRKCYQAILNAAKKIEKNEPFIPLIEYLAKERQQIAIDLERYNRPDLAKKFGTPRYVDEYNKYGSTTPISGKYEMYGNRIKELKKAKNSECLQIILDKNKDVIEAFVYGKTKAGENIFLTRLRPEKFVHTTKSNAKLALKEIEVLFTEMIAKNYGIDLKNFMKDLGRIHWWLAHCMPWERGSAAISDTLVKSIMMAKGYQPTKWIPGIIPDCEALVTANVEEFVKKYTSFYEKLPERLSIKLSTSQTKENLKNQIFAFLEKEKERTLVNRSESQPESIIPLLKQSSPELPSKDAATGQIVLNNWL